MHHDSELLRRYAEEHSEAAFGELVQRHLGAVYAVVLRRLGGDVPLAEEVTQAVFTDLARKARPLSRRDSVVGWLFVAARFAAAKAARGRHRRQELARRATLMATPAAPDSEDWTELRPLLDQAVEGLGESDREAVLLYFYGRRTYREVGAILHLTENGARMRVERALEKLRRSLGRKGIVSTAAALSGALVAQAAPAVTPALIASVSSSAVAAAGAAPIAGMALLLMTITKTQLAGALALVVVGAASLAVSQQDQISALREQLAAGAVRGRAAEQQLSTLKRRMVAQDGLVSQLRQNLRTAQAGGAGSSSANKNSEVAVVHVADILRDHPEFAALQDKEGRRATLKSYARGVAALHLPADQAARLKQLLVQREEEAWDAREAVAQSGLNEESAEARQQVNDARQESTQAIVGLVGQAAADKLETMVDPRSSNGSTDDALTDMNEAGIAPTDDQIAALGQLIRDLGNPAKNPAAAAPDFRTADPATWMSPYDSQVISQAAGVLSPAQVNLLAGARLDDNQREAIMRQYRAPGQAMMILP